MILIWQRRVKTQRLFEYKLNFAQQYHHVTERNFWLDLQQLGIYVKINLAHCFLQDTMDNME